MFEEEHAEVQHEKVKLEVGGDPNGLSKPGKPQLGVWRLFRGQRYRILLSLSLPLFLSLSVSLSGK